MRFDRCPIRWQKYSLKKTKSSHRSCGGGRMSKLLVTLGVLRFGSLRYAAVLAAFALACSVSGGSAQTADTVLFNGKIVTVDKDFPVREALAIENGRVLAS